MAAVRLSRVRTDGNSGDGVIVDGTAGGGAIDVAIANASIGFNAGNGVNAVSGSGSVTIDIIRSTIATNGLAGILSNQSGGGSSSVTVGSSLIRGNGRRHAVGRRRRLEQLFQQPRHWQPDDRQFYRFCRLAVRVSATLVVRIVLQ